LLQNKFDLEVLFSVFFFTTSECQLNA
jgi:hypothetical protein